MLRLLEQADEECFGAFQPRPPNNKLKNNGSAFFRFALFFAHQPIQHPVWDAAAGLQVGWCRTISTRGGHVSSKRRTKAPPTQAKSKTWLSISQAQASACRPRTSSHVHVAQVSGGLPLEVVRNYPRPGEGASKRKKVRQLAPNGDMSLVWDCAAKA